MGIDVRNAFWYSPVVNHPPLGDITMSETPTTDHFHDVCDEEHAPDTAFHGVKHCATCGTTLHDTFGVDGRGAPDDHGGRDVSGPQTEAGRALLGWRGQHQTWTEKRWVDAIAAIEREAVASFLARDPRHDPERRG